MLRGAAVSREKERFDRAGNRAQPYGTKNDRTGPLAMFTGSKSYCAVEKLYAADSKAGYKGIDCGPLAVGRYLTGPFMNNNVRDTIRGCIWPKVEEDDADNAYFNHGNTFEEHAIALFCQVAQCHPNDFHVPGRIECEDPEFRWMAATPDGLFYSRKADKAYVVEVKCPVGRAIETTESPRHVKLNRPFVQPVYADWANYDRAVAGQPQEEDGELTWRDMPFEEITVFQHSKIPPYYLMQTLVECKSADIPRAVFVQFQPGGLFRVPELHVTYWDFDERLWRKMSAYWKEVWKYVEEGRRKVARWTEWKSRADFLSEEEWALMKALTAELEQFPWPIKKGRGVHHIPFEFDK